MKGYVAIQKKLLTLIFTLWKNNQEFNSDHYKNTSGNHDPKSLFPVDSERILEKEVAPESATQDELPCNQSPEALFPVVKVKKIQLLKLDFLTVPCASGHCLRNIVVC